MAVSVMLQILLHVINVCQDQGSAAAPAHGRLDAVSSIYRLGSSLNRHAHCCCCSIDGALEGADDGSGVCDSVCFRPAAALRPEAARRQRRAGTQPAAAVVGPQCA